MASSSVVFRRRKKRELLFVLEYPRRSRIRSFSMSYTGLLFSSLALVLACFLVMFAYLDGVEDDFDYGAPTAGEITDADLNDFRLELIELIENTDRLVDLQKELHRVLVYHTDHANLVDQAENRIGSLDRVKQAAGLEPGEPLHEDIEGFIPGMYVRRRLEVHESISLGGRAFAAFYAKYLGPIPYRRPLRSDNFKINSSYGLRRKPLRRGRSGRMEFHKGVDLRASTGDAVYSTARGRVILARHARTGYGNLVVVEHPRGYKTYYAHLSAIRVRRDQFVRAGETIGLAGRTGNATGPHLHYEIRRGRKAVDPAEYFPR